ncbi:hypothetical protein ACWDOP_01080 [Nocardia sp. NPDC003693]
MSKEAAGEKPWPTKPVSEPAAWPLGRQRVIWVLAMLVLLGAGIGAAPLTDSDRYYRLELLHPWFSLVCWTAAWAVLVSYAPRLAFNRKLLWMTLATILGLFMLAAWLLVLFLFAVFGGDSRVATVYPGPDRRVHAVTETFTNMIDPSCRVWLREPGILFGRQVLIWEKVESGCPRVSFPDSTTISLSFGDDTPPLTTTFDPDRMRVTGVSLLR